MCFLVCTDKLGVENGDIPDENLEASHWLTSWPGYTPENGRLNGPDAWAVPFAVYNPWIQVDIGYLTSVLGLLTQSGNSNWISKLKVSTFRAVDGPEVFIKDDNGVDKVIIALVLFNCVSPEICMKAIIYITKQQDNKT